MISHPPLLQVLPWNGFKAAFSLTFDDGVPVHWELAAPEAARRGLKATFYVVAGRLADPLPWKNVLSMGHEVGNHSMDHKRVKDLTLGEEQHQVVEAKKKLEDLLTSPVSTFAYPFTEITPELKESVMSHHLIGRGGNRGDFYLAPEAEPDWADLPSQVALTDLDYGVYRGWMEENEKRCSWTLFQLHGIEGAELGWQPMPKKHFFRLLDELSERQKDFWIAPVAEIGAYWRARKILESAPTLSAGNRIHIKWKKPHFFPDGLILKTRVPKTAKVFQGGKPLPPLSEGLYPVAFDAQEFSLNLP